MDQRARWREAEGALSAGQHARALELLEKLANRNHVPPQELNTYVRAMAQAYHGLGNARAAATALLFLGDLRGAARLVANEPTDRARVHMRAGQHKESARAYEEAGWRGHAALMFERAGDHRSARVLWERLADDRRLEGDPYTRGLVLFDLSRSCERLGDERAARRHMVESVHLIEAAADVFEAQGQRERAFDCFQVLLSLGKEGAFENLAEGYLNCIRILSEDELKYYVLQYYEDFQALAMERGEFLAAATLFREAADFARKHAMPYEAAYRLRSAEAQVAAAEVAAQHGLAEMAENARAAAIDGLAAVGAFGSVRAQYQEMAQLALPAKRRARYSRLAGRLADATDSPVSATTLPSHLRMESAYPEIWRLDVVAWEQAGVTAEVMGEVLLREELADFTLRRALLCRLFALSQADDMSEDTRSELALQLGRVELYVCLEPLERLFEDQSAKVRTAVMSSLKKLFFKRSYPLIERGLRDESREVRRAAVTAVETLHFTHALDPLRRIYRQTSDSEVRHAALTSIGRVQSPEAVELLLEALFHAAPAESQVAQELLTRSDQTAADQLIRDAARDAHSGVEESRIQKVMAARGLSR
ncbi:MAG: HEAT repeat domain-containing protein [Deltaproteobacteria bacterium]|nr:HEAT repeat domain-containing protein [Deltaproteobacteria bacterium]